MLLPGRDEPDVTERMLDLTRAIAVELVLDRSHDLGARRHRARNQRVDVVDVEMELHRRAADRRRREDAEVGILVGEHDRRAGDLELGVADSSARLREPHGLLRAERLPVELDRAGRVLAAEVRAQVRHGFLPSMMWAWACDGGSGKTPPPTHSRRPATPVFSASARAPSRHRGRSKTMPRSSGFAFRIGGRSAPKPPPTSTIVRNALKSYDTATA